MGNWSGPPSAFARRVRKAAQRGLITLKFRHRVNALSVTGGVVEGVQGDVLKPSDVVRGRPSSRTVVGDCSLSAQAVIVTSGGIGANLDLIRRDWPPSASPTDRAGAAATAAWSAGSGVRKRDVLHSSRAYVLMPSCS